MANPLAEALLAGQKVQQGQQTIQLNKQKIQQQDQLQIIKQDVQHIFNLQNMISAGATDEDIFSSIQQSIQGGQGTEALIDAARILKTEGREGFVADLEAGMNEAQTFQKAGIIDLPGLTPERVQTTISSPGGVTTVTGTGGISFQAFSEEKVLADAKAESEELLRIKQSKIELQQGVSNIKVKESIQKQLNKDRSVRVTRFRDAADAARTSIPRIEKLLRQLETTNTGSFAEIKLKAKRAFGIDVANEEAFLAATNQLVLVAAEKMKGALSAQDLKFLVDSVAGLGTSVAGNIQILKDIKELANHTIGVNKKFTQFRKKKGNDVLDFEAPVFQVTASGQKFTTPEQKAARKKQLIQDIISRRKASGS